MTKLFLKIAFVVIFTATLFLTGNAEPNIIIEKDADKTSVVLNFENWKTTDVQVRIKDASGEYIWSDQINARNKSAIKYNLKNLAQGRYTLLIFDNLTMTILPLEIHDQEVSWDENQKRTVYQPVLNYDERVLNINQLVLGYPTNLKLVDEDNNIIYREKITGQDKISIRLQLKKLDKGKYTLVTSTQGEKFVKPFTVK